MQVSNIFNLENISNQEVKKMRSLLFCEECGNMLLRTRKTSQKIYKNELGMIVIECECGYKNIKTPQELKQLGILLSGSSLLEENSGSDSSFLFWYPRIFVRIKIWKIIPRLHSYILLSTIKNGGAES